ncbi:MAG: carboxypeptidase-like regulatory domain-containing protein, partial [Muribaculum sp.]|nr:carboxypeptidase-like regulatory domain-containing protein [Muribaculum sp.]
MRYFAIISILLASLPLQARNVLGTVVDETNQPASFVNVVLMSDSTFIDGKVTDDAGGFLFENVDSTANKIKISMIGYEDLLLLIPSDGNFNTLSLTPSSMMLDEVVVKADLPFTRIRGNAIVTNVANSVLATTGTANDVLKNVPMLTGSNGSFSVFGRGDAIIYINGRLVRNSSE